MIPSQTGERGGIKFIMTFLKLSSMLIIHYKAKSKEVIFPYTKKNPNEKFCL